MSLLDWDVAWRSWVWVRDQDSGGVGGGWQDPAFPLLGLSPQEGLSPICLALVRGMVGEPLKIPGSCHAQRMPAGNSKPRAGPWAMMRAGPALAQSERGKSFLHSRGD